MPKYVFECLECSLRFTRTLKMGEHPDHPCPECKASSPRLWNGQGFGFDFSAPKEAAPGNTGVAKNDYPTADQAVGASAEKRWEEIDGREKVKEKVREGGGHRALSRRHGAKKDYVEYESGGQKLVDGRKKLVEQVRQPDSR
jgi:putative FmdB family regulatory protein